MTTEPTKETPMSDEVNEVTQADIDAAEEHYPPLFWKKAARDDLALAFARYRTAFQASAGEGLRIARGIVEADLADAKEHCDADWIGLSQAALDAIDATLTTPVEASQPVGDAGEEVTIPADHPLASGLRTSQKTLDAIARLEQATISGYLALRDFPVGSTNAQFPPDEAGPNKMGTDWTAITGQLREISRISKVYDLRAAIDGACDNWTWRDLMDQCDRLASLSPPTSDERLREALVALWDDVHGSSLRLSVSTETITKVRAALNEGAA